MGARDQVPHGELNTTFNCLPHAHESDALASYLQYTLQQPCARTISRTSCAPLLQPNRTEPKQQPA